MEPGILITDLEEMITALDESEGHKVRIQINNETTANIFSIISASDPKDDVPTWVIEDELGDRKILFADEIASVEKLAA
ncbi:MAG: hypothetical protein NTX91_00795 [candidate division SR1 bacterium]|nr:hypothetical protein [candidate division SR1 bacterium]